jgi:hypothetical protein
MSFNKFNPRMIVLLLIMIAAAALRLLTHFPGHLSSISDFTPVGAMALFGGASFKGKMKPFLFPLFTLFISDLVLSFTVYSSFRSGLLYSGWYWTYLAFTLMVIAGKLLVKDVHVKNIFLAVIATTVIHWLVSDIGGCLNEKTTAAMLSLYGQRLITAIPYELNFFGGTLIYGALMFGSFEWLQRKYPNMKPAAGQSLLATQIHECL